MLDNLTQRLARVMKTLRGEARLTEDNIAAHAQMGAEGSFTHQHVTRAINSICGEPIEWDGNKFSYEVSLGLNTVYFTKNDKVQAGKVGATSRLMVVVGDRDADGDPESARMLAERLETEIKYAGYIARQDRMIRDVARHEKTLIPADFEYADLTGLTLEAREKLTRIRPKNLGQAGRIPGVSPSDVAQLSIALTVREKT